MPYLSREDRNANSRKWCAANPEKVKAAHARWYAAHPEKREELTEKMREWRAANRERYKLVYTRYRAKHREKLLAKDRRQDKERREFISAHKDKPCADCGGVFQACVMQFDHIRGKKKFNLSQAGCRSFKVIKDEIDKCEVVCANCHMVRTHIRNVASLNKGDSIGRG